MVNERPPARTNTRTAPRSTSRSPVKAPTPPSPPTRRPTRPGSLGSVEMVPLTPEAIERARERARESAREDAQAAAELQNSSKATNTYRAYKADFESFRKYCEAIGGDWREATSQSVAAYLTSMLRREHVTASTIKRARSGISNAFRDEGIVPNPARGVEVRNVLDGICRKIGTAVKKKTPILAKHLLRMLKAAENQNPVSAARDRALLTLGFTGAFRRSELVAVAVEDMTFDERGVQILIKRSKTDQHGAGRVLGIPRSKPARDRGARPAGTDGTSTGDARTRDRTGDAHTDARTGDARICPVALLEHWLDVSKIDQGPVFRSVRVCDDKVTLGEKALTPGVVASIAKHYANSAGLDENTVAGHSLRSGFATQAAQNNASEAAIMAQTGHKSLLVMRSYIQRASVFQNNAAAGILSGNEPAEER